jgi:hypothetical protein
MQKKYVPYVAVVIMLAAILFMLAPNRRRTLPVDITDFIPAGILLTDKIEFARHDALLTLEKSGNSWKVDGSSVARNDLVELFLTTLQRTEIVSPASKTVRKQLSEVIVRNGRLVKFYSNDRLTRSFYVYFDSLGIRGTYMMKPDDNMPCMVKLKGFSERNIENLFALHAAIWRENAIFGLDPADILEIEVLYPVEPDKSFKIIRNSGGDLLLSDRRQTLPAESIDKEEITDYLSFFGKIGFQPVLVSPNVLPASETPFFQIGIRDKMGGESTMKAFRIFSLPGNREIFDRNRFFAVINHDRDTVLINYADADPVMRELGDFQKK